MTVKPCIDWYQPPERAGKKGNWPRPFAEIDEIDGMFLKHVRLYK